MKSDRTLGQQLFVLLLAGAAALLAPPEIASAATCPAGGATVTANVVVFDTPIMFNRLGAQNPNWITYALKRDVVGLNGGAPSAGNAQMRKDKRIRPLTLRVNEGDCLQVNFENWLAGVANPFPLANREPPMNGGSPFVLEDDQVAGRYAGFHVRGLQLVGGISSDASNVGKNTSSLVPSGGSATYTYYAPPGSRGTYLADSYGAVFGGEATAGNTGQGMFAAVNVEPKGARWYRSQVTEEEMALATSAFTPAGQPILDYEALYPQVEPWIAEGKAGKPILNMRDVNNAIFHSDLNAIIVGPNPDGTFPPSTYPLESAGKRNPSVPDRLEPFREFTVVFHDEATSGQAFPGFFDGNPVSSRLLHGVRDAFMINYGAGGVGAEVIANRLGVGPMWDCLTCSYEEFFLSSLAVGDPAMLVDFPANLGLEACDINGANCAVVGPKATKALFPDDPSNVHHSYQGDRVVFRNLHAGKEHHIFHLHNHQWLFDANDDNANYLDAQALGPSSGYTYEINFGGAGNRNKSAGDAIFHCHFYPHFAQGMWELWRIHDVYETGTFLDVSHAGGGFHAAPFALFDGTPALHADAGGALPVGSRVRSLPDGEILDGTPIPAVVPLPGKALPLMPGDVAVVQKNANPGADDTPETPEIDNLVDSSQAYVIERDKNPGYPFWVAGVDCGADPATCTQGVVGQRPPTPVLDMLTEGQAATLRGSNPALFGPLNDMTGNDNGGWDGGLPRHAMDGFLAARGNSPDPVHHQEQTKLSFHKEIFKGKPVWFPEGGTDLEQVAMAFHAQRSHASTAVTLDGTTAPATYITNGGPPQAGAPFFEPCIDDKGKTLFAGAGAGEWFGASPNSFIPLGTSPFNATTPRVYKGANIQIDAVFNKMGYHYPQQRIISLWQDVAPFISKAKPAEPFVIRNNTLDCTRFLHTNLVPPRFEVDDYEVTTPTDIIGQHIHLPKWDLPSADGSGNGWNYEDGTLSPHTVRERIHAINAFNPEGAGNPSDSASRAPGTPLVAQAHPFFDEPEYNGARTTIQRWFFDPVLNVQQVDRGLGIIFTHDHFGPSTIQQVGLYGTVLAEPKGSVWRHNETGAAMYTRPDGGPTSWQAAILPGPGGQEFEPFREFWFQHSDFQSAYEAGTYIGAGPDGRPNGVTPDANSFRKAISTSVKIAANPVFPDVIRNAPDCGDETVRPCPEAISADDPGFFVTNYRNEPIGWRIFDPDKFGPDDKLGSQADGRAGDLAFALQSRTDRKIAALNTRLGNTPYPALTGGILTGDPFTPMLRAYAGDLIRIKSQAGGDEEEHHFTINGVKWLQGGSGHGRAPNSGWRAGQHRGISEQFTFAAPIVPSPDSLQSAIRADYAYNHSTNVDGWWSGTWGLLRSYNLPQTDLFKLPTTKVPVVLVNAGQFNNVCPNSAPLKTFDITAVLANNVLGNAVGATIPANVNPTTNVGGPLNPQGGTLVYNPRPTLLAPPVDDLGNPKQGAQQRSGPIHDPTATLLVRTDDLLPINAADTAVNRNNPDVPVRLRDNAPVEPLVLRATAGQCIVVTLRNRLPAQMPDLPGHFQVMPVVPRDKNDPEGVTYFGNNLIRPSSYIGLSPQLVAHDVTKVGLAVGRNVVLPEVGIGPLVAPGRTQTFRWYAGDLRDVPAGGLFVQRIHSGLFVQRVNIVATPVEFGGAHLSPADVIKQGSKGLAGALVIGPQGATITENDTTWDHQQPVSLDVDPTKTRKTRATGTFNGTIRDFAVVFQKAQNHYYADSAPVENIGNEAEAGDVGQGSINYGTEPMWFRFGLQPSTAFGNAGTPGSLGAVPNPEMAYDNDLVGGDPATPVFTAPAGAPVRLHVLQSSGGTRGSAFQLHGHLWQRAPYVCPGQNDGLPGLDGKCNWTDFPRNRPEALSFEIGSRAIGNNPIGMYLGAQESVLPGAHFDIVLPGDGLGPTGGAGGVEKAPGDYLFRDQGSFWNTMGLWGLLRVQ